MGALYELRPPVRERPLFGLIHRLDTAEAFDVIDYVVEQRAEKFWEINKGTPIAPVRDDDAYKLDQLNLALQKVKHLPPSMVTWRSRTTPEKASQLMLREIKFPKGVIPDVEIEPVPAVRLFDQPYINSTLMENLEVIGDPSVAVIKRFEEWRVNNDALDNPHIGKTDELGLERGYRAFEMFLFGAGGTNFLQKLKEVSVEYFSLKPEMYEDFLK